MARHRYFLRLAYDGSNYFGWQMQKGQVTVQEALTSALQTLLPDEQISVVGCGRTDTGVHAREYYLHFDLKERIEDIDCENIVFRLNRFLPKDIVFFEMYPVPIDFHARHSPVSRTYEYHLHTFKDPFIENYSYFLHADLDFGLMNEGAEIIKSYEDFTSFSKLHSSAKTNICHIERAVWVSTGHKHVFYITADRFLRNMVRAVVGTLLDLGQQKIDLQDIQKIIEGKSRSLAGRSVPAKGLFLARVVYPAIED